MLTMATVQSVKPEGQVMGGGRSIVNRGGRPGLGQRVNHRGGGPAVDGQDPWGMDAAMIVDFDCMRHV